jgi:hypothetical protein
MRPLQTLPSGIAQCDYRPNGAQRRRYRHNMKVAHSKSRVPVAPDARVAKILREASSKNLRAFVEMLAFPRH